MLRYMLDTNIAIYAIRNRPRRVRDAFRKHSGEMCLSPISLGELIYGAERSSRIEHNLAIVEGFASQLVIPVFDERAAGHFGNLRAELAAEGQIIGPYDLMIAGHARSLGLVLVSNNLKEFERVPGLRLENWAA